MNFKKIISFVLVVLFVSSVVPFSAFAVGSDGFVFAYNSNLGGAVIANYNGSDADVVIPNVDNSGNTVIGIASNAFSNKSAIKSITMPDTITYLEERAVTNCENLETVVFSQNLVDIGEYNFWYSKSLKSISLPATLSNLGAKSFAGTPALEKVEVDEKNSRFKSENGCIIEIDNEKQTVTVKVAVNSESIVIPESVTHIAEYAFSGKDAITAVAFPASPITIGKYAFQDCVSLESVSAAASVESNAFGKCTSLKDVTLKDGAEFVESEAFVGCFALENVNISATVSSIETGAFFNCAKINEIYVAENSNYYKGIVGNLVEIDTGKLIARVSDSLIPSDVKIIGSYAFYGHSDSHVSLPDSVIEIEDNAFMSMSALKSISMSKVETIGKRAFYMCENLETVVLGVALVEIGDEAFANCPFVKSYTLPETLTTIGNKAFFYNSMKLAEIYIPDSVTEMGSNVFQGCSKMIGIYCEADGQPYMWADDWIGDNNAVVYWGQKNPETDGFGFELNEDGDGYTITSYLGDAEELKIPLAYNGKPVTAIGALAFAFNDKIRVVDFGTVLESIGDSAFMYCTKLVSVNIPENITYLGANPFVFCSGLMTIDVAKNHEVYQSYKNNVIDKAEKTLIIGINGVLANDGSVTKIADYAFCGSSLSAIGIPDTITYIGNYAFANCKSLTMVSYSNPNTQIGIHLYEECSLLQDAYLPQNIKKVPNGTFLNCTSIKVCNLPNGVTEIGESAFYGCTSFTGGFLYNTSLSIIGDYAFKGCTAMTKFVVDVNITSIGKGAFAYTSLNKIENYENENFYVDGNCLIDANTQTIVAAMIELTELEDPFRIHGINASVFEGMDFLEYAIPDNVVSIGEYAFQNCVNLTSMVIPESVTKMGEWVFNDCANITDIYVVASEKPNDWDDEWLGNCPATVHWGYSPDVAEASSLLHGLKLLDESEYGENEWKAIQDIIAEVEKKDFAELSEEELKAIIERLVSATVNNPKLKEFGDLDGNEKIDASDYLFTKRSCFGSFKLNASQNARADINKDKNVDSADYVAIKRIAFGTYKVS